MRIPNFFLVGAPRCGTTALHRWLRTHPQIFVPNLKECHYFANDFGSYRSIQSQAEYLQLFEQASSEQTAVGEVSVLYLASEVAIDNIAIFNPEARFIVALRNPVDLVYSWHEQLLVTMQEDESSFDLAWARQAERAKGRLIPKTCTIPQSLQYAHIGRLGTQVERLLKRVDRDRVHFIVYDDLKASPAATCAKLLHAIAVSSTGFSEIEWVNENRSLRSTFLNRQWQHNRTVVAMRRLARNVLGDARYDRLRDAITPRLAPRRTRLPLNTNARTMLLDEFRTEVEHLSDILHRNLQHWLAA